MFNLHRASYKSNSDSSRLFILYHLPSDYTQTDIQQTLSDIVGGE